MEEVLEIRKGLNELAVIEEMMFGLAVVIIIEALLIMLYIWRTSTTND